MYHRAYGRISLWIIMEVHLQSAAQLLVQQKLLTTTDALHYQHEATHASLRLIPYLVHHNILSAIIIAQTLADQFKLSYIDLDQTHYPPLAEGIIHDTLLRQYPILPLFCREHRLYVAVDDPSQRSALHDIQFYSGLHVIPMVAETTKLNIRLTNLLNKKDYQGLANTTTMTSKLFISESSTPKHDASVVKFVNRILHLAIDKRASDIHFEPHDQHYRVRFRIDGLLKDIEMSPQTFITRIATRLKVMSNLDLSERRIPQDGRFTIQHHTTQTVDCRISTCPTIHGEKLVVRLLNTGFTTQPTLESLAFSSRDYLCFTHALARPQGLILITGPTGSGKSMTLYAALNHLNTNDKNISTVEDPVELKIQGINQVQVNTKIGLTFATVLRSFLRQDPDIIMLGEIRDLETAEIAIKASQTGHLVLSTLHTNSAAETLTRLINLGIPAFHVVNAIRLIIAQRLVRRLCDHCKCVRHDVTSQQLHELGYPKCIEPHVMLYKAMGCIHCLQGYQGRIALFEVMPMSSSIAHLMMTTERNSSQILHQAQVDGMSTIQQAGFAQILTGTTSLEEVNRVL